MLRIVEYQAASYEPPMAYSPRSMHRTRLVLAPGLASTSWVRLLDSITIYLRWLMGTCETPTAPLRQLTLPVRALQATRVLFQLASIQRAQSQDTIAMTVGRSMVFCALITATSLPSMHRAQSPPLP